MCYLANVQIAGGQPYNLHGLGQVSRGGSAPYRTSYTDRALHLINGRSGSRRSTSERYFEVFCVKLSSNIHSVGLVHKKHIESIIRNVSDVPRSLQS